jgi:recombinational DNA repair protein (RecF pathway)
MLVPRPCGESVRGNCATCDRPVCIAHSSPGPGGVVCIHCTKGETPPDTVMNVPADLAFKNEDLEAFESDRTAPPSNAWSDLT